MKLIIIVSVLVGSAFSIPTCSEIMQMRSAIGAVNDIGVGYPLLIRLAFHDCVGGCNGCINFANPDNNGLATVVQALNDIYYNNSFQSFGVSRADFWAFAASVGLSSAVRAGNRDRNASQPCTIQSCPGPCPVPCLTLKWGRVDADSCPDEPALPSATMNSTALFSYFQQEFGFNKSQVVTIMGAHSLGGAKSENTGYKGKFTGKSNHGLSEIFYSQMVDSGIKWKNVNAAPSGSTAKWQFNASDVVDKINEGFRLNTDFELFYDLTLDANAKTTCVLRHLCGLTTSDTCSTSCPKASTFDQALAYSKNCTLFMQDFVDAFGRMVTNKNLNLQSSGPCCPL